MLLEFKDVDTYYGDLHVLKQVNYTIGEGEIISLLGGNASGKSTTMKTILGLVRPAAGTVFYMGENINGLSTADRVRRGIAPVPEARRLFPRMTIRENLEMGAFTRDDKEEIEADLERVFTLFPRIKERLAQAAGTLSGGEQQMVAIARALMARPKLLLLDEPSLGLAPLIVKQIFAVIREINEKDSVTVFLVEQNAYHALKLAHRGYVMVNGQITLSGTGRDLLSNPEVRAAYLEGGHG